jgi:hypothetical protein
MLSGGKPVDGKNLWRKFNETKGYIIRYCSPIWLMHSSSGASRADIIKNTLPYKIDFAMDDLLREGQPIIPEPPSRNRDYSTDVSRLG